MTHSGIIQIWPMSVIRYVTPVSVPQLRATAAIRTNDCLLLSIRNKSIVAETEKLMHADRCSNVSDSALGMAAAMTPAAKGRANPAISLSTFISSLFFAKVAINFLTLHGLASNFVFVVLVN